MIQTQAKAILQPFDNWCMWKESQTSRLFSKWGLGAIHLQLCLLTDEASGSAQWCPNQRVLLQTVLSGDVWKAISLVIQLHNVTVELLTSHATPKQSQQSLARLDFIRSRLSFESYSDQSKDIDLVSHEIVVSDTRFTGEYLDMLCPLPNISVFFVVGYYCLSYVSATFREHLCIVLWCILLLHAYSQRPLCSKVKK